MIRRVYGGAVHRHEAQSAGVVSVISMNAKNTRSA